MKTVLTSKTLHWGINTTYEEAFDELQKAAGKIIEEGETRFKRLITTSHSITQELRSSPSMVKYVWKGSLMIVHEALD